jgi:hypothetical protein
MSLIWMSDIRTGHDAIRHSRPSAFAKCLRSVPACALSSATAAVLIGNLSS